MPRSGSFIWDKEIKVVVHLLPSQAAPRWSNTGGYGYLEYTSPRLLDTWGCWIRDVVGSLHSLIKRRISSARQAVVFGPSLIAAGNLPSFTPAHHRERLTGKSASTSGSRRKPVSGSRTSDDGCSRRHGRLALFAFHGGAIARVEKTGPKYSTFFIACCFAIWI